MKKCKPNKQSRTFLYRIQETDKLGKRKKHLAEVHADCNENARRKIIHVTMQRGGTVQSIDPTDDPGRYPGDSAKVTYE